MNAATHPRIKICGITNLDDALAAADLGVEYLGFVFATSARQVDRQTVTAIRSRIPSTIRAVGVFVNASRQDIMETCRECGLDVAQLHGDERPEMAGALGGVDAWKALRIRSESDVARVADYRGFVSAVLLDAYCCGSAGGTGHVFDWTLAREARQHGVPIVLAGGLDQDNVRAAIRVVGASVVDVSSGVESVPGKKDHSRLRLFVKSVRQSEVPAER